MDLMATPGLRYDWWRNGEHANTSNIKGIPVLRPACSCQKNTYDSVRLITTSPLGHVVSHDFTTANTNISARG